MGSDKRAEVGNEFYRARENAPAATVFPLRDGIVLVGAENKHVIHIDNAWIICGDVGCKGCAHFREKWF